MSSRAALRDLVDSLPRNAIGGLVEQSIDSSFFAHPVAPASYVWPDVIVDDDKHASPVLLVTAPGAMGKSVAARATAHRLGSPLVDLAKVAIGGDGLTGLLTRVLGWTQAPQFVTSLQRGTASLVLDSLDEAHLAAGRAHFLAFMKNVVELVGQGSSNSQVVIFGRRDTMESAYLALAEYGVEAQQVSISPLAYGQTCELIDLVLDDIVHQGRSYDLHRQHSVPFGQHRDAVLLDMARALGSDAQTVQLAWESVGGFLGYPPVVRVLGRHLVIDNPAALNSSTAPRTSGSTRGGLLREVVEEILDRESAKVRDQLRPALGLEPSDPRLGVLYSREEQIVRLLQRSRGGGREIALPGSLSPDENAIYQDQIENFLPDHPFLRGSGFENVVFSDYVLAYETLADTVQVHGTTNSAPNATSVGPFFAHFVHAMSATSRVDGDEVAVLREACIDAVLKSYSAGCIDPSNFVYSDNPDQTRLFLGEGVDHPTGPSDVLKFTISERSGVVELTSPLGRGLVITRGSVVISGVADEIQLGPDLSVFAEDIQFVGKRIGVSSAMGSTIGDSSDNDGRVTLIARGSVDSDPEMKLSVYPATALAIFWSNPSYQWLGHVLKLAPGSISGLPPAAAWQLMFGLRRLLTSFQASATADPSAFSEFVDRIIVGSNPVFHVALEGLVELGIVSREGALYRLRLARLSDYGVNYAALRGPDFENTLEGLYSDMMKTDSLQEFARDESGNE
ncbi:hypothetical protein FHP29_12440 [Nocardioides albidus]|uniref:Uncharacterized protein n=1 Tax=Nocardioides albidus TaxID=1517589 RepID=A0A5C4VUS8_9ACTN|nr:hypothetical protein [Nocardioides albidus]TNM39672.1 hypothetical protein FHP29_12440 [Nocardioides albidus]